MTLPRAETLAAGLVGRPVHMYLGLEVRVVRIEGAEVVVANARGGECARVALADIQAGLDQLEAEGEVAVTLSALGPGAAYVAAMLAEVEGAGFGNRRATYDERGGQVRRGCATVSWAG